MVLSQSSTRSFEIEFIVGEKQDKPGQGKRKNRGDEEVCSRIPGQQQESFTFLYKAQAEKEKAQQEDDEEDQPKKKSIKKSPSKEAEPSARVTRSQDAKVQDARSSKGSQATNGTKPGNGKRKNKKT